MEPIVTHHPDRHRFEITVGDELAGVLDYRLSGDTAEMPHTEVFPQFGGRGLASLLARAALDHARSAGWTVVPTCSFVAGYLSKHPEYADLVR